MAQFNIQDYDRYIVSFSGGKDSTATFLYLLDHGIPREKIELWHQDSVNWSTDCSRYGRTKPASAASRIQPRTITSSISPRYFIARPAKDRK